MTRDTYDEGDIEEMMAPLCAKLGMSFGQFLTEIPLRAPAFVQKLTAAGWEYCPPASTCLLPVDSIRMIEAN